MKPKTLTYEYIRLWRSNETYSYIYILNVALTNLRRSFNIGLKNMSDEDELNLAKLIYGYFKDNRELQQSFYKIINLLQEIRLMYERKYISLDVLKIFIKEDFKECWVFYKYFLKKNKNTTLQEMCTLTDNFLIEIFE